MIWENHFKERAHRLICAACARSRPVKVETCPTGGMGEDPPLTKGGVGESPPYYTGIQEQRRGYGGIPHGLGGMGVSPMVLGRV